MNIDWGKIRQKAVDIAVDGGKGFVRHVEKTTRDIEKTAERKAKQEGRVLPDKAYEKLDEMYDTIDNAYEKIYDLEEKYHSRYKITDEEDFCEDDEYYDDQYESVDEEIEENDYAGKYLAKLTEEDLEEKVSEQINSSSKTFELNQDDIVKTESRWHSLGKLKNIECDLISTDVAGLLRLSVAGQVVYIVRVIEIKSGGFNKKISDLKNFTNISNRKLRDKIGKNLSCIDVEILNVGKTTEDVDLVRALEKNMIKYYKPKWN